MYDQEKILFFKRVLIGLLIIVTLIVGFLIGQTTNSPVNPSEELTIAESTEKLTEKTVQDFLLAYFTKKDLSENRDRYKPLMTENMYAQEIAKEELPINQAYKGYTVDQVFDKATVYLNYEQNIALVQVDYHNTLLQKRGSTEGALTNNKAKATLRIWFSEKNNQYLVNRIDDMVIEEIRVGGVSNTYQPSIPVVPLESENKSSFNAESTENHTSSSEETKIIEGGLRW